MTFSIGHLLGAMAGKGLIPVIIYLLLVYFNYMINTIDIPRLLKVCWQIWLAYRSRKLSHRLLEHTEVHNSTKPSHQDGTSYVSLGIDYLHTPSYLKTMECAGKTPDRKQGTIFIREKMLEEDRVMCQSLLAETVDIVSFREIHSARLVASETLLNFSVTGERDVIKLFGDKHRGLCTNFDTQRH